MKSCKRIIANNAGVSIVEALIGFALIAITTIEIPILQKDASPSSSSTRLLDFQKPNYVT